MSDMAPIGPIPTLKTEPGGSLSHEGELQNVVGVGQLSSVVVGGMNGNSSNGTIMMPTIISDESISAPTSPIGSGMFEWLTNIDANVSIQDYALSLIKKYIMVFTFFLQISMIVILVQRLKCCLHRRWLPVQYCQIVQYVVIEQLENTMVHLRVMGVKVM